jgi:hypothetical protein
MMDFQLPDAATTLAPWRGDVGAAGGSVRTGVQNVGFSFDL